MSDNDLSRNRFPWLRSGFDLEGYVGALAAWLLAILLGWLWGPLFWIGFIAAIVILFATRTAERTAPVGENLIIAPCDGLVVSVGGATPPDELRLEGTGWTRVRVSVGPTKTNGFYAPMDGAIDHIIRETGDPAAFAATKPDRPGLAVAYVALESGDRAVGVRLATGGLGPRLEINGEPGDAVRLGRNIGTMRLGGWCDIYLPGDVEVAPLVGQTLIGSETVLGRFGGVAADLFEREREPEPVVEPVPVAVGATVEATPAEQGSVSVSPRDVKAEDADDALTLEKIAGAVSSAEVMAEDEEEDVSEMFARLRKEARKTYDDE
jgi:phosphatidylserine decarboxylase